MPRFSERSRRNLSTCHPELRELFQEVIQHFDCIVLEGHRGEEKQNEMHRMGRSQLKWPESKHNRTPSEAVDVAPWPVDWSDTDRFRMFGGFVLGIASQLGMKVRWGGDWDQDTEVSDQTFQDLPHFERVG